MVAVFPTGSNYTDILSIARRPPLDEWRGPPDYSVDQYFISKAKILDLSWGKEEIEYYPLLLVSTFLISLISYLNTGGRDMAHDDK